MDKIAFLFAGQGSQFVGMGADFFGGKSGGIYDVIRDGPTDELNKTINTQPAIYLHDLAVAEELHLRGVTPNCVAGFSLGEIPALVFAGAMSNKDGLAFVNVRANAMQEACEKNGGTMIAVMRLGTDKIKEIASQFNNVWPVNFNSPEQTVCACSLESADAFTEAVTKQGGRAIRLRVSGAFHCPYMNDARKKISQHLKNIAISSPIIPLYSNLTAKLYDGDYKELISEQVSSPVLWQQTIENMIADGITIFVEVGPGNILSGLVKKISDNVKILSASDMGSIKKVVEELK